MRYSYTDTLPAYVPIREYSNTPRNEYECKQARWLEPEEYIVNGYKPMSAFRCLKELRERVVPHGVKDGKFWFRSETTALTPGIKASILYHADTLSEIYENNNGNP